MIYLWSYYKPTNKLGTETLQNSSANFPRRIQDSQKVPLLTNSILFCKKDIYGDHGVRGLI